MATTVHNPRKTDQRWAWIWIAYSGFLFIQPIFEPSWHLWLGTFAVFAVFIGLYALYVRAFDCDQTPQRYWLIAAIFALGLITFPWNNGGSTFFVYAASFIPFSVVSKRRIAALYALATLAVLAEHFAFPGHNDALSASWPNTLIAIFLMVIIGGGNIFAAEQKRGNAKLRLAHEEIEALAAVAERERIARDLHDVLGHTLSLIAVKAELAKRLIPTNPERSIAEIADVESTARTALAEVREAIGGYRSRGLPAEIESARRALAAAGITLQIGEGVGAGAPDLSHLEIGAATTLSPAEETVLALALREAVTNIVRHSRATTCRLRLVVQHGHHRLHIEDDGHNPTTHEGNGLRGMRERVEALGGTLSIHREHGTRLLIDLPLHKGHA